MRFDDLMYELRDWLHGAGWTVWVGGLAVLIVLVLAGAVLWPTLKPKPEPQLAQPLSSVATTSTPVQSGAVPVPTDAKQAIMDDLGIEDSGAVSVSWIDDTHTRIMARVAKGPTDFDSFEYVKRDEGWTRK